MLDERHEYVEQTIRGQPEHATPQPVIAAQRLDPLLGDGNQVLDHRRRNVVAVQCRVERRLVATRARVKPVPLQDAVVECGVGVLVVGERLMKRAIGDRAVILIGVGLEQRTVLAVGQRHLVAVAERNRRELDVGGRQR